MDNLRMKEFRKHESMFSWVIRRTPDAPLYAKTVWKDKEHFWVTLIRRMQEVFLKAKKCIPAITQQTEA